MPGGLVVDCNSSSYYANTVWMSKRIGNLLKFCLQKWTQLLCSIPHKSLFYSEKYIFCAS